MKFINQSIVAYLILFLSLISCGLRTSDKIDANSVNKQIKERKIKQIKENDIAEKGFSIGSSIIKTISIDQACGDLSLDIFADSLKPYIKKAWIECSTPTDEIEKSVWEAYQYNLDNNLPLNDNIQKIITSSNKKSYLYSSAMNNNGSLKIVQIELNHKALVLALY
ncbi:MULTISPECIES: hypothetical protein [unclassified Flammeovirga]|uniref:hypothetical protein n=1 Tax=unclassified Flammeovirga TaxID=2637820 RepID=UPI0012E04982|nr:MULTISPECIES: hypothetical protein [unclassified Flammeovirga]MBD0400129.1 hypothetical protein [Flammeovirga sp. EKP202]